MTYTTNDNTITVTSFRGSIPSPGAVIIPETVGDLPVVSIGPGAFAFRFDLTAVTIPDSVTNVADIAFEGCSALKSVTIGNRVIHLGNNAFESCSILSNLTIPDSVTSIGKYLCHASGVTRVTIGDGVADLGENVFGSCFKLTNVFIGNGVKSIGPWAFIQCVGLSSVTIPNSVTNILNSAFYCTGLTNLTIGNGVTCIGDSAFGNCSNLTRVTIPASVNCILDATFNNCPRLSTVVFEGSPPPILGNLLFSWETPKIYFLPGAMGWGPTYSWLPTYLWNPAVSPVDPGFGVKNGKFGFNIAGTPGITVIVEASTNLARGPWVPVSTNTLIGGTAYFSDPASLTNASGLYRFRTP